MDHAHAGDPALTIAIALAVGMLAQSLARHLRVPGIVLLLAAGVVLGPDVAGIVRPEALGATLHTLVGFAVAVILFEGGMNLNLRRLRREARSIRQLVSVGALVTWIGSAVAARLILGWGWVPAILFGSLVIVTGPTVVTPLLRRIRVHPRVATVLEAEGVLVDAVGAIVAVVALQVAISPTGRALAFAPWELTSRLGLGLLLGLGGGLLIAVLLRREHVVPEGLENVLTLSLALALFQGSNSLLPESGIVTVTVAGFAVGNVRTRALAELREFKEQLTVLFIGMLFVLLAADVRLEEVRSLGWPGAMTVLAVMLVVRPLNVLAGTAGSDLTAREKAFLCWLAPRGIVAAAVASLFAQTLTAAGIAGGNELRAMVFLVIAGTVLVQGLSGGIVASLLGVRRPVDSGYVVLGANDLGRALGRALRDSGHQIVFIETNHDACRAAEAEGFRVLYGSGLDEGILHRADLEGRAGCVAVTANDEVNLLFARKARDEFKVPRCWVALRRGHVSVTEEMVRDAGARLLFGEPREVDLWTIRLERGLAVEETWIHGPDPADRAGETKEAEEKEKTKDDVEDVRGIHRLVLALAVTRGKKTFLVDEETSFREADAIRVLVFSEQRDEAVARLRAAGWIPAPAGAGEKAESERAPA